MWIMTGGAGAPGGVIEVRNTTISNIADFGMRIEKQDAAAATVRLVDTVRISMSQWTSMRRLCSHSHTLTHAHTRRTNLIPHKLTGVHEAHEYTHLCCSFVRTYTYVHTHTLTHSHLCRGPFVLVLVQAFAR